MEGKKCGRRSRGELMVILSGVLFGMMPFFAKCIYAHGGDAYTLIFVRFLFGGAFLFGILIFGEKISIRLNETELKSLLLLSVPFVVTPVLLYSSYSYISSGLATTLHFCYPIVVIMIETTVFKKRPSRITCICCGLCVFGILMFYEPSGQNSVFGMLLAVFSGVWYAVYVIGLTRGVAREMDPLKTAAWLSGLSAMEIFMVASAMNKVHFTMDVTGWGLNIIMAIGIASVALLAFQKGASICGAQKTTLLSTTEPLTSIVMGAFLLHESMTARAGLGVLCIISSICLLMIGEKQNVSEIKEI